MADTLEERHVLIRVTGDARVVEAYNRISQTGDRSMLLWNVLDSHQTRSYDQALAVLEDIMNFEGHEEMREHFQWPKNWS